METDSKRNKYTLTIELDGEELVKRKVDADKWNLFISEFPTPLEFVKELNDEFNKRCKQ